VASGGFPPGGHYPNHFNLNGPTTRLSAFQNIEGSLTEFPPPLDPISQDFPAGGRSVDSLRQTVKNLGVSGVEEAVEQASHKENTGGT
jgi:hypothetical protein